MTAGKSTFLFDCGPGTLTRLQRLGMDYLDIDYIFLSHHHPDHCADTVALLFANRLEGGRRDGRPLYIVGPPKTQAFVETLYSVFPGLRPRDVDVRTIEQSAGRVDGEGWTVSMGSVQHSNVPAVAYRIEADGHTVVYSGDTSECPEIISIAQDADIFICECSYPAGTPTDAHLTPPAAGRIATQAGVRRLVLTHMNPECDRVDVVRQCGTEYAGPIARAEDCTEL